MLGELRPRKGSHSHVKQNWGSKAGLCDLEHFFTIYCLGVEETLEILRSKPIWGRPHGGGNAWVGCHGLPSPQSWVKSETGGDPGYGVCLPNCEGRGVTGQARPFRWGCLSFLGRGTTLWPVASRSLCH